MSDTSDELGQLASAVRVGRRRPGRRRPSAFGFLFKWTAIVAACFVAACVVLFGIASVNQPVSTDYGSILHSQLAVQDQGFTVVAILVLVGLVIAVLYWLLRTAVGSALRDPVKRPGPEAVRLVVCANCDTPIGLLEPVYDWNGSLVCRPCAMRLTNRFQTAPTQEYTDA